MSMAALTPNLAAPAPSSSSYYANPNATATAAAVTLTAVANAVNYISTIYWSYDGTPTGGGITIQDVAGTTVWAVDITTGGPGFLPLVPPIANAAVSTALIVTLASAGAVKGKLTLRAGTQVPG